MTDDSKYLYWLTFEKNEPIPFENVPLILADARWPDQGDDDREDWGIACYGYECDLLGAVRSGTLTVRNAVTLSPERHFAETVISRAVLLPLNDLAPYLNLAGVFGVRIGLEAEIAVTPADSTLERDETTLAPAPPVISGLGGLPTAEIAYCFDGIQYTEKGWRKPLGEKLKWLEGALYERGAPPKPNLWRPVEFAAALHRQYGIAPRRLRARFQTQQALKPWKQAWLAYEVEYIGTDVN